MDPNSDWVTWTVRTIITVGIPFLAATLVKIVKDIDRSIRTVTTTERALKKHQKALKKHMKREEEKGAIQDDRLTHVEKKLTEIIPIVDGLKESQEAINNKLDLLVNLAPKRATDDINAPTN